MSAVDEELGFAGMYAIAHIGQARSAVEEYRLSEGALGVDFEELLIRDRQYQRRRESIRPVRDPPEVPVDHLVEDALARRHDR